MLAGTAPSRGRRSGRWPALALLCLAQFIDVLSVTIVLVALPSIQDELGFSDADLQWVVSTYALCFGGFLMLSGRAADLYGCRRLFMAGIGLFSLASLIAGLASSAVLLVVARAAQGLGAAIVVPAALSLLTTTFPEGVARNRALGIWTATAAGGGAAGLVLGGVLTDAFGWRWVFLVNVPVGVAALLLAPWLLVESRDPAASRRLDVLGAVTVTAGLVLLIYGLTRAQDAGLASPATMGPLASAAVLLVGFLAVERRVSTPLTPLGVFRSHDLVGANLVALALTAATSPPGVLLTLYLQVVLGLSPTATGCPTFRSASRWWPAPWSAPGSPPAQASRRRWPWAPVRWWRACCSSRGSRSRAAWPCWCLAWRSPALGWDRRRSPRRPPGPRPAAGRLTNRCVEPSTWLWSAASPRVSKTRP